MNVYKKLQQARLKLQSAPLKKSGRNKHVGYEYFELADFLPTIQTIFAEVGLCGTVSFGTELATLTIVDTDATDATQPNFVIFSSPMSTAELKGCHAIQNLGAVQTYLRRYLYVAAMEIVEHDSLDATTGKDEPKKAKATEKSPTSVDQNASWQNDLIICKEDPNDPTVWRQSIIFGTEAKFEFCTSVSTLMQTFKVNKTSYDRLKAESPDEFTALMNKFTETKTKLEEKENG
jgi:hypothetical protein